VLHTCLSLLPSSPSILSITSRSFRDGSCWFTGCERPRLVVVCGFICISTCPVDYHFCSRASIEIIGFVMDLVGLQADLHLTPLGGCLWLHLYFHLSTGLPHLFSCEHERNKSCRSHRGHRFRDGSCWFTGFDRPPVGWALLASSVFPLVHWTTTSVLVRA
jgi:hypothetical protein